MSKLARCLESVPKQYRADMEAKIDAKIQDNFRDDATTVATIDDILVDLYAERADVVSQIEAQLPKEVAPKGGTPKLATDTKFSVNLAPNGKKSNLSPEHYATVRTPAFKKWFGDWEGIRNDHQLWSREDVSKVVDENYEPLVVYHGTTEAGFSQFETPTRSKSMTPGAYFFAKDRYTARSYANRTHDDAVITGESDRSKDGIYPVFLNIRNPHEQSFDGFNWDGQAIEPRYEMIGYNDEVLYPHGADYWSSLEELHEEMRDLGYDPENGTNFEIREVDDLGLTTDMVVREAKGYNDGAIMRDVTDPGPASVVTEPTDVFVVFNSANVKSATQNVGTFDPANPDIRYSLNTGFYSALERGARNVKQKSLPAAAWINNLMKQPNVKKEEIFWTGLGDWLAMKKGQVTKDEVLEFLEHGGVRVNEVVKTGAFDPAAKLPSGIEVMENPYARRDSENVFGVVYEDQTLATGRTREEALEQAFEDHPYFWGEQSETTKYEREPLILPGGENYREILLTIPNADAGLTMDQLAMREYGMPYGELRATEKKALTDKRKAGDFQSSHWDEKNVVLHMRLNDRMINGEDTLFIEEIQSDWNLEGRREGFKGDPTGWMVESGNSELFYLNKKEAEKVAKETGGRVLELSDGSFTTPKAPFVTDSSWQNLALKRIMRIAAEEGYARVAWVTGEQTADRYSLDKHLEKIEVMEVAKGDQKRIILVAKDGGLTNLWLDKEGTVKDSTGQNAYIGKTLDEVVGKEVADRVLSIDGDGVLEEGDLKVEAKWARELYDKSIPDRMKKLFGVPVEAASILEPVNIETDVWMLRETGKDPHHKYGYYNTEAEAKAAAAKVGGQLSVPVTPKIRSQLTGEGSPLFSLAKEPRVKTTKTGQFETGKPVTFNFVHNTESATSIYGKPKKDSQFNRGYEPSGRYMTHVDTPNPDLPTGMIQGEITFNNPLVIPNDSLNWKKTLSLAYGGKRGKHLSKALIAAGYDGVVTVDTLRSGETYTSEILDLTTFDEAKAKYSLKTESQLRAQATRLRDLATREKSRYLTDIDSVAAAVKGKQPASVQQFAVKEDIDRMVAKMAQGKEITDALRSTIITRTPTRSLLTIRQNLEGKGYTILEVDNLYPTDSTYKHIALKLGKKGSELIHELLIVSPNMYDTKIGVGHDLYSITRELDRLADLGLKDDALVMFNSALKKISDRLYVFADAADKKELTKSTSSLVVDPAKAKAQRVSGSPTVKSVIADSRSSLENLLENLPAPALANLVTASNKSTAGLISSIIKSPLQQKVTESNNTVNTILPERHADYFNMDNPATLTLPIDNIIPAKSEDATLASSIRAKNNMLDAAAGKIDKRQPITVVANGDGTFTVQDGNSTFTAVKNRGWESIPAIVKKQDEAPMGENPEVRYSVRTKPAPKKTQKAYKLFRVDPRHPGKLFPLFVDANTPIDLDVWLDAEAGELTATGKVKSKLGPLAYRPGWHAGDLPLATHIGQGGQPPTHRPDNQVWAEVEMAADVDWQAEADKRGTNTKGKVVPVKAHITDQIPADGFYRYKTNPNMTGNWLIGGSMKVTRVLTDAEVARINEEAGTADLPRVNPVDLQTFGFTQNVIDGETYLNDLTYTPSTGLATDQSSNQAGLKKSEMATLPATIAIDGVDRSTTNSEGRPIAQTEEGIRNFWKWFGDSKVVDADGRPLVVYRGQAAMFNDDSLHQRYFTEDAEYAATYDGEPANVLPVYLQIVNPKLADGDYVHDYTWFSDRSKLVSEGYDGLHGNDHASADTWVALVSPTQIKSATGNTGAFDGKNPDTRYSITPYDRVIKETFKTKEEARATLLNRVMTVVDDFKSADTRGQIFDNLRTYLVDRYMPINKELGQQVYRLHRMMNNSAASMATFLQHGKMHWADNVLNVGTKNEGFVPWFKSLDGEGHKFLYWVAAKRAEKLDAQDRENWLTADRRKIILDKADADGMTAKYEQWNTKLQEFNSNIIDIAVESGLVSADARDKWMSHYYLPFYRHIEDGGTLDDFVTAPTHSRRHISSGIKTLKGGEAMLGDPLQNIIRNWSHLIAESQRQVARSAAGEMMIGMGIAQEMTRGQLIKVLGVKSVFGVRDNTTGRVSWAPYEGMDRQTVEAMISGNNSLVEKQMINTTPDQKTASSVMSYMRDGKPVYLKLDDPDLYMALTEVNTKALDNGLLTGAAWFKRMLTLGATFGASFRIANFIRDSIHTSVVSKSFLPLIDSGKGLVQVWRQSPDYIELMASGGGFSQGYLNSADPKALARSIDKLTKFDQTNILDTPMKLLDFWERVGHASEMAARVQFYSNLKAKGESKMDAAFEAKDLLDFSLSGKGDLIRVMTATIPFLNARMQGLDRMARGAQANPTAFLIKGALVTAASLALWSLHYDDERYKELENWDKWTYHHFWIGKTHYRIPKAFEVGAIFSTIWEAAADAAIGDEDWKFFAEALKHTFVHTFAVNMPTVAAPLTEVWANKSMFTGRQIESEWQQKLEPGARSTPWDSPTLKIIGEKLNISPAKMQTLIRGYTATIGTGLLSVADYMLSFNEDFGMPKKYVHEYVGLDRFISDKVKGTKYATRYHEFAEEAMQTFNTINNYQKMGDFKIAKEKAEEKPDYATRKKLVDRISKRLSTIRQQEKMIWSDKSMSPEVKRERLENMRRMKNAVYREAYGAVKEISK